MKIRLRGVTVGGLDTSVSIEKFSTSGWEVRTHDTARAGGNGGNLLVLRNHAGQECVLRSLYFVGSG